jgi:membrane associated rhomboid family serine protease/Flp pilus assembly protein TadD
MLFSGASEGITPAISPSAGPAKDTSHPVQQGGALPRAVVTHALVSVCVTVFLAMSLSRVSPTHPSSQQLLRWGANFGPLTIGGQWWRLPSSAFLHIGLVHLAVNMWCLWDLGSFAERIYGRTSFLAIYLITGVAAAMFSLVWHPFAVEAGASGAIFGIAGALIASFYFGNLPFPRQSIKAALLSVIAFAGYNLFVGMLRSGAGNAAHIGGLISGFVLGLLLARLSARRSVLMVAVLSILLGCVLLARTKGYVVQADQGRAALTSGQSDAAIRALTESVRKNPKFAEGHFLLGQAYMQRRQFAQAENAYRHGLGLKPKSSDMHYQLGVAVMAQGRAKDAMAIFGDLAKSDPSNPEAEIGIGTAAEMTGDYQLAFTAFRRAAQLDPRNVQAYSNLGLAALQTKQFDEAVAAFSRCVQLQPNSAEPLLSLAVAYKAKGMDREAEAAYKRAIELSQKNR